MKIFDRVKSKDNYSDFASECYAHNKDLAGEMKCEISRLMDEYKNGKKSCDEQAEKIMQLIFATKYEW